MNEMKGIQFVFFFKKKKLFNFFFFTSTDVTDEGRIYELSDHLVHLG